MGVIRLLLALAVVLAHTGPIYGFTLTGGKVAVQAFFIVSGFYMSMILNEKYIKENDSYWLFLSNRLMRLFPVYWAVLLLTIVFSVVIGVIYKEMPYFDMYVRYWNDMSFSSIAFLVLTNIILFGQDIVMFLGLDTFTGHLFLAKDFRQTSPMLYTFLFIPQAWTIGIELTFYLIAPFLMRRPIGVIVSLIVASVLLRIFLYRNGFSDDPWDYRFFPTELAFFMVGNISYLLYKRAKSIMIKRFTAYTSLFFILGLTIVYSYLPAWFKWNLFFLPFTRKECLYFASFALLLPIIFQHTKKWRLDTYIGELSYPVYISHMFVLLAVDTFYPESSNIKGITVILGTLVLSVALNELVAKKVEVIRQRRVKTIRTDKPGLEQAKAVL